MNIRKIIVWLMLIIMTVIIFMFSAQDVEQSAELSKGVVKEVLETVIPNYDHLSTEDQGSMIRLYHHWSRKFAHFTIYSIWSALLSLLVFLYGVGHKKQNITVLSAGFLYACSDEFHQLFVSGRGAQWSDVFLDFLGVIVGLLVFWGFHALYARAKKY